MFLLHVCMCLVPEVVRRGHLVLWLWSHTTAVWMLGAKPQSSARATSTLHHRTTPAQTIVSIIENTLKFKRPETDGFSVCWE